MGNGSMIGDMGRAAVSTPKDRFTKASGKTVCGTGKANSPSTKKAHSMKRFTKASLCRALWTQ